MGCGCANRETQIGGAGLALARVGALAARAVAADDGRAVSAWAARRLAAPRPRPIYGGAAAISGGPVSSGGRYRSSWATRRPTRIGEITDTGFLDQVSALDRDHNAVQTAVCGSPRTPTCDTEAGRTMGEAWRTGWLEALEGWRTARDGWRTGEAGGLLGTGWGFGVADWERLEQFRTELARYRGELEAQTGARLPPSAAAAPSSAGRELTRTVGDVADAIRWAAIAVVVFLVLRAVV